MSVTLPVQVVPRHETIPAPASPGKASYFTSRGDNIGGGTRGDGTALRLTSAGAGTETVQVQFLEPVEIHDAEIFWDGGYGFDDEVGLSLVCPANAVTPNAGAGNCNLTAVTGGNRIDPDPETDGTHDVTLANAIPVIAEDENGEPNGYWNVDWSSLDGAITPVDDIEAPNGNCDLFDFAMEPKTIPNVGMGSARLLFEMDTYRIQHVHPKQKLKLKVVKVGSGSGEVGAWILLFRRKTT